MKLSFGGLSMELPMKKIHGGVGESSTTFVDVLQDKQDSAAQRSSSTMIP
jgi:hypothetical protein